MFWSTTWVKINLNKSILHTGPNRRQIHTFSSFTILFVGIRSVNHNYTQNGRVWSETPFVRLYRPRKVNTILSNRVMNINHIADVELRSNSFREHDTCFSSASTIKMLPPAHTYFAKVFRTSPVVELKWCRWHFRQHIATNSWIFSLTLIVEVIVTVSPLENIWYPRKWRIKSCGL